MAGSNSPGIAGDTVAKPKKKNSELAINGGTPVREPDREWPRWPAISPDAAEALTQVLHSGRWAISSPHAGKLAEQRFAHLFAEYTGTRHCIPTDHGSSALVIALEALGLDFGDPVIVPALTWVASASAVLRAGLVPVLADVDPRHGCLTADTVRRPGTDAKAIVAVHWACAMADVPELAKATGTPQVPVIEDAAQAHGARWNGRPAGSLGRLGCFSMQHSKVLTCGEGGAVVTDDGDLAGRLEELRADSRRNRPAARPGELDLAETASILGANFSISEFGAALLCAQLRILDQQHERRNTNYRALARLLAGIPGVRLLQHSSAQDRLSLYEVPILFDNLKQGVDNAWLAAALTEELGMRAYTPRPPLHRSRLLQPSTKSTLKPLSRLFHERNDNRVFPGAEWLACHAVLLHHSAFLGPPEDMRDIADAVAKVATAAEA